MKRIAVGCLVVEILLVVLLSTTVLAEEVILDVAFEDEAHVRELFNFVGIAEIEDGILKTEAPGGWELSGIVIREPFELDPNAWLVIEAHVRPILTVDDSPTILSVVDAENVAKTGVFGFLFNSSRVAAMFTTIAGQWTPTASDPGVVQMGKVHIVQIWNKPGRAQLVVKSADGDILYQSKTLPTQLDSNMTVMFGDVEAAAGTGKSEWERIRVFYTE